MLTTTPKSSNNILDLEKHLSDGRLTMPSDGHSYDFRKMYSLVKQLGRPLTEKESEQFRIR